MGKYLLILFLSIGIFLLPCSEICFGEETEDGEFIQRSKAEDFEKRLDRLTEDVERIIKNDMEEKEDMRELQENLHQLTKELTNLRKQPPDEIETEPEREVETKISQEETSDEHLYFEGLGNNENLPGRAISIDDLRVSLWIQYRLMYNASNIPGPADTTFGNTKSYNLLRQRARLGIDIRPFENVGGYAQLNLEAAWVSVLE